MIQLLKWMKKHIRIERVLFADLDRTVIETKSGKTFPEDNQDWKFKKGIRTALREYNPTHLHIISNQGGIGTGYVNELEFCYKMRAIKRHLAVCLPRTMITSDYCKSIDPNDIRRKPNCGMIDDYVDDYYGGTDCSKRNCLMIGDASGKVGQFSDSDKRCAENAGIRYMDVEDFIEAYASKEGRL